MNTSRTPSSGPSRATEKRRWRSPMPRLAGRVERAHFDPPQIDTRRVDPVRSEGSVGTSPSARLSDHGTGPEATSDSIRMSAISAARPIARASFSSVSMVGRNTPHSMRAIAACVAPIRSACSTCVSPASVSRKHPLSPLLDSRLPERPSTTRPDTTWTDIS